MSLGLIGIIVSLVLFLLLVYIGFSSYYVSAICAVIVAVTNTMDPLSAFTETYVSGIYGIMTSLFSIVFLGCILGRIFTDTGAATSIADMLVKSFLKNQSGNRKIGIALLIMLIIGGLFTMGGIDGYVLTFTLFPVALFMSEACDIPRRFIPGLLVLNCAFMAAPGAPQITNVIAVSAVNGMGYEVSATSGMVSGIVGAVIIAVGGFLTLYIMITKARAAGEHFEYGPVQKIPDATERKLPNFFVALLPLIAVFVCYTVLHLNIAIALTAGILINLALMQQYIPRVSPHGTQCSGIAAIKTTLNAGADQFPGALMMISAPAALAAVIQSTSAFQGLTEILASWNINIYLFVFLAVALIVLFTSSPPAALMVSIPLALSVAQARGIDINPHAVLRIAAFTSITFESLPWNGTVLICQSMSKTNHLQSYPAYFWQTVVWTTAAALAAVLLYVMIPGLI